VPSLSGSATQSVAPNEARKRRAKLRHVVGCCEELARHLCLTSFNWTTGDAREARRNELAVHGNVRDVGVTVI
jgi:hypothetical protein